MSTETLQRFWDLSDRLAANLPGREGLGAAVFEPVGLILEKPPVRYQYDETPLNSACFAHAGVHGVHFSFLQVDGQVSEESPVVMTVPGSDDPNLVVGANLLEFLRLGCRAGYLLLDGLTEDLDMAIGDIESAEDLFEESHDEFRELLDALSAEFGLFPWHDIETRLRELQRQFRAAVQLA